MGSTSDLPVMEKAAKLLDEMQVPFEMNALSAHRTPEAVEDFAKNAAGRGIKVIIAAAGMAAALPGVIAASTTLPVIGVPIKGSVLDGVDAFRLNYQVVVLHIEHLDDTGRADVSFGHSGIETVSAQIIQTVHIQLSAHQLVEEALGIFVLEDLDGKGELPFQLLVHALHEHQRDFFVRDACYDGVFEYMRERTMSYIVQEDGGLYSFGFAIEDEVAFGSKGSDSFAHQVKCTQRVLETGMLGTRIHGGRQSQLFDAGQTLEEGMLYDVVQQPLGYVDESEYGVVDDFTGIWHVCHFLNGKYTLSL